MDSGVYIIKNLFSGHMYIGSSSQLNRRRKDHFSALNRGNHKNKFLQSSYIKHKGKGFIFGVIEHCEASNLEKTEQLYIDKYWDTKLYNSYRYANIKRASEEGKLKQSKLKDDYKVPLLQYSLNGEFIKSWDSCLAACKIYGNGVRACLNGRLITCKESFFFYKKTFTEGDLNYKLDLYMASIKKRAVYKYDLNGVLLVKYQNLNECAKAEDNGVLKNISRVCLGQRHTFKKYLFKYVD